MPLPKPRKNETEEKFVERCMADDIMIAEFPDQKQRLAVCYSQALKNKDMKKDYRVM